MSQTGVRLCGVCDGPSHSQDKQRLDFELQYKDAKHDIDLSQRITTDPSIRVDEIIHDAIDLLHLDKISDDEIRLVGFGDETGIHRLNIKDPRIKLIKSGIPNHCILFLEPTENAKPPKLCSLNIIGPDEKETKRFQWYRAKTTLTMLLDFVIEAFSLEKLERDRIHLVTLIRELDVYQHSDKRLSQFNLHDGMSIYVQIMLPPSQTISSENKEPIRVKCTCNKENFDLEGSNIETINDIKKQIQQRFNKSTITQFKIRNENKDELDITDPDRSLLSFGIKSNQTISVEFKVVDKESTSTRKPGKVSILYTDLSNRTETFMMPLTNTIDDVIKEVEERTRNSRLMIAKMCANDTRIDFKNDKRRCLADLGLKNENTIEITLNKIVTRASIVSQPSNSPPISIKKRKIPIGLDNLGNSCYMNSAFQCLAHVPQLTEQFLHNIDLAHADNSKPRNPYNQVGEITGAFAELLWFLWRPERVPDDDYKSFIPRRLKESIGKKDKRFSKDDQQDTQEFLTFFLDTIHEELRKQNRNQQTTIINELFFGDLSSTILCTACNKQESSKQPINFLSIPLEQRERRFWIHFISKKGKTEQFHVEVSIDSLVENVVDEFSERYGRPSIFFFILVMLVNGGEEIDCKTPIQVIPTDEFIFMEQEVRLRDQRPERLKSPEKKPTLDDSLKVFFSQEQLQDGWTCPQKTCRKKTLAIKQFQLSELPTILIIQFKRFSHANGYHEKVETFVKYPIEGLDLSEYTPSVKKHNAIYDLIAVSVHMGSISGGHYVAYAQHIEGNSKEWYKFDDSAVTRVKPEDYKYEIVTRDAYLLFYMKRNRESKV